MRNFALGRVAVGLVVSALACGGAAAAGIVTYGEQDRPLAEERYPPFRSALPACNDPGVLAEISWSFKGREWEYWGSGLEIDSFYPPFEYGYRTDGLSYIPRRYCQADALFNDGLRRRVVYNIAEALGFIGIGSGVTWCIVGLDRNHAFSPNCRAAGP
ncbi:hypothetical protein [Methylocystis echinoides]|jgi:hypothetical protein|uniref:hypothetical protein n=1 Tax=Methylocystis echinoides TaxID=29468 RepID=UPI003430A2E8